MKWLNFATLLLSISSLSSRTVQSLDYSDLETTGVSCPTRDSCVMMRHMNPPAAFNDRNCECDSQCTLFNDCCIDHSRVLSRNRSPQRLSTTCTAFGGQDATGAYMVNRCRRDYRGQAEVRRNCEGGTNMSDPLIAVPATDAANDITYSNRYCAECNHAVPEDLSSWIIRVSCEALVNEHNVSEDYIVSNLEYRANGNVWGVNHWDDEQEMNDFYQCDIIFDMPPYLADNVRLCRYNAISTCPRTWRRQYIRRMCESYMAVVYHANSVYKNPHCALCNDVGVDVMACDRGIVSRKKQPLSFALLLDVNRSDGDVVGVSNQATPSCAANQKYDPFFKRCRSLVCALPGYTMSNGKCVRS